MRMSEMMENKLWTVLCALLLLLTVNLGSTEDGNDQAAASLSALGEKVSTEAPAADSSPAPILETTSRLAPALNGSDTNTSSSGTGSLSSNMTKEEEIIIQAPVEKNDTNIASPTAPAVPENSSNQTDGLSLLTTPQTLPSESQNTTSQTTTASTSQTTTTSPRHDTPVATTTTNSSNYPTSPTPASISTSKQPGEPKTHPPTSAPTPEPPKPETTITTTTTTATSTQSKSTSSTSSSQKSPNTPTSPHTSQSHAPQDQAKSTTGPSSSSTPQAKAHADTPSQLNVGGDTMMVHESPTLDPLLAGLVTAFIITAVVITLLLFLKLRRRDNRPEFRRLQDLPMDDMMEDTPLSMYSY
ncbi:flocculation protein FLO11 [Hippoglossus stenolepis]|uniref:flocculation protein FLO11 n=1 Tax=Hippoglossus stenolepis TaxID=195615 RepID=UPI00159C957E|nr:flocculation protein FLO11 [Hippoglossus stenolepis]